MKTYLLSLFLLLLGIKGLCTTWTVTNSGTAFTPASITITSGDDVSFDLDAPHNAVEVSQSVYNANGNTPLAGGFQTPFGGGLVQSTQLTAGIHYYVCSPHASVGMKGIIIVQNTTGINENKIQPDFSVYPNPSDNLLTIKAKDKLIGLEYYIVDQVGRRVVTGRLLSEITPVEISGLKKGVYFIQLIGDRKQSVEWVKK